LQGSTTQKDMVRDRETTVKVNQGRLIPPQTKLAFERYKREREVKKKNRGKWFFVWSVLG
jgi:hypothetical protein